MPCLDTMTMQMHARLCQDMGLEIRSIICIDDLNLDSILFSGLLACTYARRSIGSYSIHFRLLRWGWRRKIWSQTLIRYGDYNYYNPFLRKTFFNERKFEILNFKVDFAELKLFFVVVSNFSSWKKSLRLGPNGEMRIWT